MQQPTRVPAQGFGTAQQRQIVSSAKPKMLSNIGRRRENHRVFGPSVFRRIPTGLLGPDVVRAQQAPIEPRGNGSIIRFKKTGCAGPQMSMVAKTMTIIRPTTLQTIEKESSRFQSHGCSISIKPPHWFTSQGGATCRHQRIPQQ
jgi:hypothetical protein